MSYATTLDKVKLSNIKIILDEARKQGITNKFSLCAILAVVSKESGFIPDYEIGYQNTSTQRLRKIFPDKLSKLKDIEIDALKKNEVAFFNYIYGGLYGNNDKEGYKFRGGGLNQLTFKDNYKKYAELTGIDLVNFPEKINEIQTASKVLIAYFKRRFEKSKDVVKLRYKSTGVNDFKDLFTAVDSYYNANAGFVKDTRGSSNDGYALAHDRSKSLMTLV